jgi:acylphosphatase
MQRLTAIISGKVQKAGYRGKVVTIAKVLEIKGYVKNLADGRVKVVAEGDEHDLERFARALVMKNTIIDVSGIETEYSHPTGEYDGFAKMVDSGETDARLDSAVDHLKVLVDLTKQGLGKQDLMLGLQNQMLGKQDQMLSLQDQMLGKQDQMLDLQDRMLKKQDDLVDKMDETKNEIVGEIRELRSDLKSILEDRLSRIESDVAQIKAKVGL